LFSFQYVSGEDTYPDGHFSKHGFQFLLAQSDVMDDEFYFPDDLMDEKPG
jgi:hypothetical protein